MDLCIEKTVHHEIEYLLEGVDDGEVGVGVAV